MKQSGYRNPFEGRRRREPARSKEEVLRRILNHRQAQHGTSNMTKQFNCPACEELYTQLGLVMVNNDKS